MLKRPIVLAALAGIVLPILSQPVHSQGWPQRPVKIIVPYPAGGNTDGIARIIAQRLSGALGQQFVVESRPGAGGAIAAEAVARAPADGYTLFVTAMAILAIVPAIGKTSYDPVKDFTPVSNIGTNSMVLATHPSFPATSLAEFVAHVRSQPQKYSYAAGNIGSMGHLSMELFQKRAGLQIVPVMYKGGVAVLTDVIAGHVPMFIQPLSDVVPHAKTGALRLLAVSSDKRAPQIPDVPTFHESGYPGFKTISWNGLIAPAGTPRDIVDRIAQEISRAVKDPEIAQRLARFGVDPLGNSPQEFAAQIAADIAQWAEAVKLAGLQTQ